MSASEALATLDTNIAVYALTSGGKEDAALHALASCSFLSVQVLNEFVNVSRRKLGNDWQVIGQDVDRLKRAVPRVLSVEEVHHDRAIRLAGRYRLSFYDALMLAVALEGGARTIYSEDMHHGLVIDDTLRILDPFR